VDERDEHLVLPPPHCDVGLPPAAEDPLGHRGEEGEDGEGSEREERLVLQPLDLVERLLAQPRAEAHVDEQLEHGTAEERPQRDGAAGVVVSTGSASVA